MSQADQATITTSDLREYIQEELGELLSGLIVYNILHCAIGAFLQGDKEAIRDRFMDISTAESLVNTQDDFDTNSLTQS